MKPLPSKTVWSQVGDSNKVFSVDLQFHDNHTSRNGQFSLLFHPPHSDKNRKMVDVCRARKAKLKCGSATNLLKKITGGLCTCCTIRGMVESLSLGFHFKRYWGTPYQVINSIGRTAVFFLNWSFNFTSKKRYSRRIAALFRLLIPVHFGIISALNEYYTIF